MTLRYKVMVSFIQKFGDCKPPQDMLGNADQVNDILLFLLQAALARHYWLQGVEWDCPHCRRCHLCRHQTSLARLPPVFIIHLSR